MANDDIINDVEIIGAFKEKTKEKFHELAAMDAESVANYVKDYVEKTVAAYNLDVTVEDIVVSGSRCRGLETDASDLDVIVYFSGSEREDDFFNILHEEGILIGGVSLDINPISREETGSLSEYLTGVENYLAEKEARLIIEAEKPVYIDDAAKIAAEIDRFSLDFDSREYKDTVNNWEVQVQNMADDIRNGNTSEYKDYLREIISQSNDIEDVRKSAELLVKLAEYKPLAKVEEVEEENLNQIDNYLSNTVPKAEERKEIRNTEHERIEEDEQKRRQKGRQSLRARLAEKKAIVAANSKDRQKDKQREVQSKKLASEIDL